MAPRIILDFPLPSGEPARRLFYSPQRIITAPTHADVLPALHEIQASAQDGATAIGFISYEAAPAFDAAFRTRPPGAVPLLWFALFEQERRANETLDVAAPALHWQADTTEATHGQAIARIHAEIAAGTTYQVNHTIRLHAQFTVDPLTAYETLRSGQGTGYHACIETDEWCVLSLSPELFFETDGRMLRMRPMKGTRPRGRFNEEDDALTEELRASEKERAENLMIVDLMRNDAGRVARTGSVRVTRLYDVERYPTVLQMTSTIEAELREDVALPQIMSALFPPGSVTGAPKISTMRLIAELETSPRGVYCGALGIVQRDRATFNVPIRTIWLDRKTGRAEYGTGSGITADAQATDEYRELLTKAAVVSRWWPRFQLLETMRAQHGAVVRLERHLRRLAESAEYFGFGLCAAETLQQVSDSARGIEQPARLRLLLDKDGRITIEVQALEPLPAVRSVICAQRPVDARDPFLYHKTTCRRTYDAHAAEAASAVFDVLLYNEREEVTEFTRANIVVQLEGKRYTPARSCGLLAGVFRGELLEQNVIAERVIHRHELARAERIWWINSVREWVDVELS